VADGRLLWKIDIDCDEVAQPTSVASASSRRRMNKPVPIAASPALMMMTLPPSGESGPSDGSSVAAAAQQPSHRVWIGNQRGCIAIIQLDAGSIELFSATLIARLRLPPGAELFSTPVCVDGQAWVGARNNALYGLRLRCDHGSPFSQRMNRILP